ncbi:MAG TPA: tripartite tricarboxylate transporter substrate binding protein [Burkholderiales bacterium]|nr:tripartite tricarboxylate transporter substrate binding protein [Burkholderiales bacterium]
MKRFALAPRPLSRACALAGLVFASAALAQGYPSRAVHVVIPLSAGGTTDVPGRLIAQKLSETLGQQFYVENKAGAGGMIGSDYVAKSKPDGYTLLLTATPFVITPHVYKKMPYQALADFAPVVRIASGPYVLVVHPSLGVHSVKELIALARKQPGKIDFASSGNGSAQHLVTALFAYMAGIQLNHVPYKGSGPAQQDLIAGIVKMSFVGTPIAIPHMKAGRLIALGVSTSKRSPEMPDVPTIAEAGVPGYEARVWIGMLAPTGTPHEIVARLNGEIGELVRTEEMRKLLLPTGMEPDPDTPEQFGAFLKADYDKWGKVVKESGATVN